jgi:hypothetical protein
MGRAYFISQEQLNEWVGSGSAEVMGDLFVLRLDRQYFARMQPAVFFTRIISSPQDKRGLEGRVLDMESIDRMGAQSSGGSVVVGEDAYDVAEGWLLKETLPMQVNKDDAVSMKAPSDPSRASADGDKSELDLLASLVLDRLREDHKD